MAPLLLTAALLALAAIAGSVFLQLDERRPRFRRTPR